MISAEVGRVLAASDRFQPIGYILKPYHGRVLVLRCRCCGELQETTITREEWLRTDSLKET